MMMLMMMVSTALIIVGVTDDDGYPDDEVRLPLVALRLLSFLVVPAGLFEVVVLAAYASLIRTSSRSL